MPICVSEPIGFASPRRMAITPAIVVVLTAPMPTSRMPSFPLQVLRFSADFSQPGTISSERADGRTCDVPSAARDAMQAFVKKSRSRPLSRRRWLGVKLGDRCWSSGCSDPALHRRARGEGRTDRPRVRGRRVDERAARPRDSSREEGALIETLHDTAEDRSCRDDADAFDRRRRCATSCARPTRTRDGRAALSRRFACCAPAGAASSSNGAARGRGLLWRASPAARRQRVRRPSRSIAAQRRRLRRCPRRSAERDGTDSSSKAVKRNA